MQFDEGHGAIYKPDMHEVHIPYRIIETSRLADNPRNELNHAATASQNIWRLQAKPAAKFDIAYPVLDLNGQLDRSQLATFKAAIDDFEAEVNIQKTLG